MSYFAASYEVSTACILCKITQQAAGNKPTLIIKYITLFGIIFKTHRFHIFKRITFGKFVKNYLIQYFMHKKRRLPRAPFFIKEWKYEEDKFILTKKILFVKHCFTISSHYLFISHQMIRVYSGTGFLLRGMAGPYFGQHVLLNTFLNTFFDHKGMWFPQHKQKEIPQRQMTYIVTFSQCLCLRRD